MSSNDRIKSLEAQLFKYELQSVGIYTPKHILNTKAEFKSAIKQNLKEQKTCSNPKYLFDSRGDIQNLLVENFNFKCSRLVDELNGYNLKSAKCKVRDYANELIEICDNNDIKVTSHKLFELKIEQLALETDYLLFQAKQKYEKQEQARQVREQRKADMEWFDRAKELERQYRKCMENNDKEKAADIKTQIEQAQFMLRNRKAGWVYIISNDDMREGLYKIGLSRRSNPVVRINELSNASHAFRFKIHAIIYSDNCFDLETKLHRRFAGKRVNQDNFHKEFFEVSLDEIQKVLKDEFGIDIDMHEDLYEDSERLEEFYNFKFEDEETEEY